LLGDLHRHNGLNCSSNLDCFAPPSNNPNTRNRI
jgi:hypothetical protein